MILNSHVETRARAASRILTRPTGQERGVHAASTIGLLRLANSSEAAVGHKLKRRERRAPVLRKGRQAFTLVEMLLVLVILATLAAIVYPKVANRGEQARVTAAQTQIGNFKTVLDTFEVDNGYYPKGKNGLQDLVQKPRDAVNWRGPYIESIPKDPWNNDYIYECPGKHNPNSYDISSLGPPGKDTVIGNWQTQK